MDSHKATEVRSQLGPLKDFAERTGIAVSTITHPLKGTSSKAIDHFIGSQAFIAAARIGHLCVKEFTELEDEEGKKTQEETGRILFCHARHAASAKQPTIAYQIETADTGKQDRRTGKPIIASRVAWAELLDITADEAAAAAAANRKSDSRSQTQNEVQAFLRVLLKDGPVAQSQIGQEAKKRGFSYAQLDRAKDHLRIISRKGGFGGGWTWELPS